jgi:hypothetical protein
MPETNLGVVALRSGFTWWLSLPTWGSMWMGLPALCTGLWLIAARRGYKAYLLGAVLSCRCSRRWLFSGDVKFPRRRYLMES